MRKCNKCNKSKPLKQFYRKGWRLNKNFDKQRYSGKCKTCCSIYDKKIIEKRKKHKDRFMRWRKRNPTKIAAQNSLRKAVLFGKIIKPKKCDICHKLTPKRLLGGHHEDYSKPLDVTWTCPQCHSNLRIQQLNPAPKRLSKYDIMNIIEEESKLDMDYHGIACEKIATKLHKEIYG